MTARASPCLYIVLHLQLRGMDSYPFPSTYTAYISSDINECKFTRTYHFFFCFFAPVAAGAMVNVDVWVVEMSLFRFSPLLSPL